MSDLQVQLDLLEQLASDLGSIAAQYRDADDFADRLGDEVGDDTLGDRVHDFAHKWNDRRKNMTEQVEALQQQVQAIHDAFRNVDDELLKALQDGAQDAPAGAQPGRTPQP